MPRARQWVHTRLTELPVRHKQTTRRDWQNVCWGMILRPAPLATLFPGRSEPLVRDEYLPIWGQGRRVLHLRQRQGTTATRFSNLATLPSASRLGCKESTHVALGQPE